MEKGYCDYCYIFNHCGWFCSKEKDEHNPIEPCFSREYENTDQLKDTQYKEFIRLIRRLLL